MGLWYPEAKRSLLRSGCGGYVGHAPWRGVLHHTEGDSLSGALQTYPRTGDYPQFTVDENTVEQHCSLAVASTALKHPSGTIDTNRLYCIQIEIVGWTKNAANMSDALCARLARLMRWIEAQTGIHPQYTNLNRRFTASEWQNFGSWCGHAHVPNNDHTDPGNIPLAKLFVTTPALTVTTSEREYLNVDAKCIQFDNVKLGDKGTGWEGVNVPSDKITGVIQHGSFEPVDGDWPICSFAKQQRVQNGYQSVIEITNGAPNQTITFEVWYVE